MSTKDMCQGRKRTSTETLADRLRKAAGRGLIINDDPAAFREAADRLEEQEKKLVRLSRLDDYDQKRHSGLLEE